MVDLTKPVITDAEAREASGDEVIDAMAKQAAACQAALVSSMTMLDGGINIGIYTQEVVRFAASVAAGHMLTEGKGNADHYFDETVKVFRAMFDDALRRQTARETVN